MRRLVAGVLFALVLFGCGDDRAERSWIDEVNDFPEGPTIEGQRTRVDEGQRVLYVEDCAVAKRATSDGGQYGPEPRTAANPAGRNGYAYICRTGT